MPLAVIIGASPDPERPSNLAVARLLARGWTVVPVHPRAAAIHGVPAIRSLHEAPAQPELVCSYVNPEIGAGLLPAVARLRPRALWLNPGSADARLIAAAQALGLRTVDACLLVALATGDPLDCLGGATPPASAR